MICFLRCYRVFAKIKKIDRMNDQFCSMYGVKMSFVFARWKDEIISIEEYDKNIHDYVTCPLGHRLCGKKGNLVVHHFAHYSDETCDPWRNGGMSEWHKSTQEIVVDKSLIEYRIDRNGILHIA